ncbi:MAG: alpha/beta fold hydrolase [Halobacteriovoraceae bacterium]|nr:alpha/beta fold hydrolase [Halobacteriovoraceae bacterium]
MRKIIYILLFCLPLYSIYSEEVEIENWPLIWQYFTEQKLTSEYYQLKGDDLKSYQLRYLHVNRNSKNLIFISTGRAEIIEKYYEIIYDLRNVNADILIIDQLGQGLSSRIVQNKYVGYINNYDQYVESIAQLLRDKKFSHYQSRFAIGHSMGGVIVHLLNTKYPLFFKYAVLTSPSFEISFGAMPKWFALLILKLMTFFGYGEDFGPGLGPFKKTSFIGNELTSSPFRFKHFRNDIYLNKNQFGMLGMDGAIGGPSVHWISETVRIGEKIQSKNEFTSVVPFTIIQAQRDEVVDNIGQNNVCKTHKNCELIVIKDSKHEPFIETDEIKNMVLNIIKEKIIKIFSNQSQ